MKELTTLAGYVPTAFTHNQWILLLPGTSLNIVKRHPNDFVCVLLHKCKSGAISSTWYKNAEDVLRLPTDPLLSYICCKNCYAIPTAEEMPILTATWLLWTRQ